MIPSKVQEDFFVAFQTVFKRYELKYMLTPEQKEKVLAAMAPYMKLDKYGRTTMHRSASALPPCAIIADR